MIGFILITHNRIGNELIKTVDQILNTTNPIEVVSICHGDDPEQSQKKLQEALLNFKEYQGVVLLLDLFGATPANLCQNLFNPGKVEMLSGCNLPIILKAATTKFEKGPHEAARFLKQYGQDHIAIHSTKF